jgi:hypothetical protein
LAPRVRSPFYFGSRQAVAQRATRRLAAILNQSRLYRPSYFCDGWIFGSRRTAVDRRLDASGVKLTRRLRIPFMQLRMLGLFLSVSQRIIIFDQSRENDAIFDLND